MGWTPAAPRLQQDLRNIEVEGDCALICDAEFTSCEVKLHHGEQSDCSVTLHEPDGTVHEATFLRGCGPASFEFDPTDTSDGGSGGSGGAGG